MITEQKLQEYEKLVRAVARSRAQHGGELKINLTGRELGELCEEIRAVRATVLSGLTAAEPASSVASTSAPPCDTSRPVPGQDKARPLSPRSPKTTPKKLGGPLG